MDLDFVKISATILHFNEGNYVYRYATAGKFVSGLLAIISAVYFRKV